MGKHYIKSIVSFCNGEFRLSLSEECPKYKELNGKDINTLSKRYKRQIEIYEVPVLLIKDPTTDVQLEFL